MNIQKVSRLAKSYFNYIKKNTRTNYFPCRVWIEVTNNCNLKCRLCPNKDIPSADKGFMDFGLYKQIMDQLGHRVNDIYLFHRGEPFLHPRLIDMITYAKKTPATIRIHTNATLLDQENTDRIIKSGLDFISFSFDGYDKKTYEAQRINSSFEHTLENIIYFLERKKQLSSPLPYTVLQVMEYGSEQNKTVKERFLKNFDRLPLNRIVTRKPHNWAGLVPGENHDRNNYVACTFLWYALVILFNGDMVPCPQDFKASLKLGNIKHDSIDSVFKGKSMQRLREKIAGKDIADLVPCNHCDRLWRDTFMGLPTDYLKTFLKDNLGAS